MNIQVSNRIKRALLGLFLVGMQATMLVAADVSPKAGQTADPKILDITINTNIPINNHFPVTILSQNQINVAGGFTITQPGNYLLDGDVLFDPFNGNGSYAITVDADNVLLDLNAAVLQANCVSSTNLRAIRVLGGREKVTIKNGCITMFDDDGVTVGAGCSQITLDNLVITECGGKAIRFDGTKNVHITNSIIHECTVTKCAGNNVLFDKDAGAICMFFCDNFKVDKCCINENGTFERGFAGFVLDRCEKCQVNDCQVNCNKGRELVTGYKLLSIDGCCFTNCTARENQASEESPKSQVYGFNVRDRSDGNLFKNCTAIKNTAQETAIGFSCGIDGVQAIFMECESIGQCAKWAVGFSSVRSFENEFHQCKALGQQGTDYGIGFLINQGHGTVMVGCEADDATGPGGDGIRIVETNQCVVRDCQALRNERYGINEVPLSPTTNSIYSNFACENGVADYNINDSFPITSANSKGVGETENVTCEGLPPSIDEEILEKVCELRDKKDLGLGCPTKLLAEDFEGGLLIDEPGTYIMCEDVLLDLAESSSMVCIAAPHVIFDMNGYSISQVEGGEDCVHGIVIKTEIVDVFVKNGTISNTTGNGILVQNLCENIRLCGLTVFNCGSKEDEKHGINFAGADYNIIADCLIKNCVSNNGDGFGAKFMCCKKIDIIGSKFNNNQCDGINAHECSAFALIDSEAQENGSEEVDDLVPLSGLHMDECDCWLIRGCRFNGNGTTDFGTGCGIACIETTGMILLDSQLCGNKGDSGGFGLKLTDGSSHWLVRNCSFNDNKVHGGGNVQFIAAGVLVTAFGGDPSNGNLFEDCVASGNEATSGSNIANNAGFRVGSDGNCFIRCVAKDNKTDGSGRGDGFFFNTNAEGCLARECQAVGNDDWGFFEADGDFENTYLGNVATGNGNSGQFNSNIRHEDWDLSNQTPEADFVLPDIQNLAIFLP